MCYVARGTRIGTDDRYRVEAWLGFSQARAECELFAARDRQSGEVVLVKVFPIEEGGADRSVPAFERQARQVAELSHPALAPLVDFGRLKAAWGEPLCYVVEHCAPGPTLGDVVEARLPATQAAPLVRPLVDGCIYLRAHGHWVDVPAHEVFIQAPRQIKWGVFGLQPLPADRIPSALADVHRLYPELNTAA